MKAKDFLFRATLSVLGGALLGLLTLIAWVECERGGGQLMSSSENVVQARYLATGKH